MAPSLDKKSFKGCNSVWNYALINSFFYNHFHMLTNHLIVKVLDTSILQLSHSCIASEIHTTAARQDPNAKWSSCKKTKPTYNTKQQILTPWYINKDNAYDTKLMTIQTACQFLQTIRHTKLIEKKTNLGSNFSPMITCSFLVSTLVVVATVSWVRNTVEISENRLNDSTLVSPDNV